MQFLWLHIKDLVGKGIGLGIMAEFFVYAVFTMVPLGLPLAILLASLMTFGNLGESFELTAMKAAGISLFRIMRPLMVAIALVCVGAFYFSNYVLPVAQGKLWALLFSLRQKSPELDIPVGEFYSGIDGFNIYVRGKDGKWLTDMMIYDLSSGFNNMTVMTADSGYVQLTADKKHLKLNLYRGETFENLKEQGKNTTGNVPYRREEFKQKELLIEFDSDLSRYDESTLKDQHISKNIYQLAESIDSVRREADAKIQQQSIDMISRNYLGRENVKNRPIPATTPSPGAAVSPDDPKLMQTRDFIESVESVEEKEKDSIVMAEVKPEPEPEPEKEELKGFYDADSLFLTLSQSEMEKAAYQAFVKARDKKEQVAYNRMMVNHSITYIRRHEIELHRKFTLSFACLIFFFIGAPLGAIIRKGGFGLPAVISVLMFIVYYIIDNTGYKMAREGIWEVWQGIWLSSAVLLPVGIFLTYKAAVDATLFNADSYKKAFHTIKMKISGIFRKKRSKSTVKLQEYH